MDIDPGTGLHTCMPVLAAGNVCSGVSDSGRLALEVPEDLSRLVDRSALVQTGVFHLQSNILGC